MFPSFLFRKNNTSDIILIFDIKNSSISGALVKIDNTNKPKILFSTRKNIISSPYLNQKRLLLALEQSLKSVCEDIRMRGFLSVRKNEGGEIILKEVFCFLSSPWCVSQVRTLILTKDDPFLVSNNTVKDLLNREEEDFKNSFLKLFTKGMEEMEVVEKKIIDIKINGYRVNNPFSKKVNNMEVSLYESVAPKNLVVNIKDIIFSSFHTKDISLCSFLLPAFSSLRDILNSGDDFIFIDVGAGVSDILFVKNNLLTGVFSLPIGRDSLVREIQDTFKTTFQEAVSMLNIHKGGKSLENISSRLDISLNKVNTRWSSMFIDSFRLLDQSIVPKDVFITADDDVIMYWFTKFLTDQSLIDLTLSGQPFNITYINTRMLSNFCDIDSLSQNNSSLVQEAIFVDVSNKENKRRS